MIRAAAALFALLIVSACAPTIQQAQPVPAGFTGPRLEEQSVVVQDGARLPMAVWRPAGEPEVVILALHGMNDTWATWWMAGPWWAERGAVVYAYDQRGFGGAPEPGVWGGEALFTEDLRTIAALIRAEHPDVPLVLAGESLGSAVIIAALASDRPPEADRAVLLAPAVWGWSAQPIPNRAALWVSARLLGETAVEPPEFVTNDIWASDNLLELIRMGRDPGQVLTTRFDAIYGLVDMMEVAADDLPRVRVPVAYLYGGEDDLIAMAPTRRALRGLPAESRTAFYPEGHHLLVRDHDAETVMADVLSFARDPAAEWPSGAGPIPLADR